MEYGHETTLRVHFTCFLLRTHTQINRHIPRTAVSENTAPFVSFSFFGFTIRETSHLEAGAENHFD
jgi:hypothetical protein